MILSTFCCISEACRCVQNKLCREYKLAGSGFFTVVCSVGLAQLCLHWHTLHGNVQDIERSHASSVNCSLHQPMYWIPLVSSDCWCFCFDFIKASNFAVHVCTGGVRSMLGRSKHVILWRTCSRCRKGCLPWKTPVPCMTCRCAGFCPHVVATLWSSSLESRLLVCKVCCSLYYLATVFQQLHWTHKAPFHIHLTACVSHARLALLCMHDKHLSPAVYQTLHPMQE